MKLKFPLAPLAVLNLVRELRTTTSRDARLALGGAPLLVEALRRELTRDGDPSALSTGLGRPDALVYVLGGDVSEEDERVLRDADIENVPVIVLGPEPTTPVPYVLATDVLPLRAGEGFPLDELARLLGGKIDEAATSLAARLPVLRPGIARALVEKVSRQNGIVAAAVFVPGVDFPVLTLNQLRLVLRLAAAYGEELSVQRLPEILGVVGAGVGLRAAARSALSIVPVAGWAVKGGVAYTGTRALGEAAIAYFEARSGGGGTEPGAPGADRA